MGNVEQAGVFAGPFMLGDDAGGVLHGQRIAREGHHAATRGDMSVAERHGAERFFGIGL
jgi:hypothetical protein